MTATNPLAGTLAVTGGTLRLSGPAGAAPAASAVSISTGGTLYLDSRTASGGNHVAGDRLNDAAPVELRGGTLLLGGVDGGLTAETVGELRAAAGASTVRVEAGSGGGSARLSFGTLGPRAEGATVNFSGGSLGDAERVLIGGGQPAGFVGGWAVANRRDFAKYDVARGVVGLEGGGITR